MISQRIYNINIVRYSMYLVKRTAVRNLLEKEVIEGHREKERYWEERENGRRTRGGIEGKKERREHERRVGGEIGEV